MCLVTDNPVIRKATKDIDVYKLFYPGLKSPFQEFQYEQDKLYKTKIEEAKGLYDKCFFDRHDEGYSKERYPEGRESDKLTFYEIGFNSIATLERVKNHLYEGCSLDEDYTPSYDEVHRCVIPKGAKYVEGFTDLVISNQIIVKEKVEL